MYSLDKLETEKRSLWQSAKEFSVYLKGEGGKLIIAFIFVILNSASGIITPFLIAYAIDTYITQGDARGLMIMLAWLFALYIISSSFGYIQAKVIGDVSQRTLFRLRTELFRKIQNLPVAFFNQNKTGDLISRINNDTGKVNELLSYTIGHFVGVSSVIFGIGAFALVLNWKLGLIMLSPVLGLYIFTKIFTPILEKANKNNFQAMGQLSASLQENLSNFRVVAAYGKKDYFKNHLRNASEATFKSAYRADVLNRILEPIYDFAGAIALLLVLVGGFYLISLNELTIGLLIGFLTYTYRFYDPLKTLAGMFGSISKAIAAWSRISALFGLENSIQILPKESQNAEAKKYRVMFDDVSFGYEEGAMILENVHLKFEAGKTYALVGPTGGGKTTLANLMSRLYDPVVGKVYLDGQDIRTFEHLERTKIISVILQDPILFSGTVAENIKYGNEEIEQMSEAELKDLIEARGMGEIMNRFSEGLNTKIGQGSGLSLGQKQLISFMRAVLRQPKLLILDEATANIDTITENLLTQALNALPKDTTKVIIAHRLNTIKDADEILFVNGRHVEQAGSFDDAVVLIHSAKKAS